MFRRLSLWPFGRRPTPQGPAPTNAAAQSIAASSVPNGQTSRDEQWSFSGMLSTLSDNYPGYEETYRAEIIACLRGIANSDDDTKGAIRDTLTMAFSGVVINYEGADREIDRARRRIEGSFEDSIFREGKTLRALIRHLGRECLVAGAASVEAVPNRSRSGLAYATVVPPEQIDIKRIDDGLLEYYQNYPSAGAPLHPMTYGYTPVGLDGRSAYGIPELISLLKTIERFAKFHDSLDKVLELMRTGALMSIGIEQPDAQSLGVDHKNSPEYWTELPKHMTKLAETYAGQKEKRGVVVHLAENEIKMNSLATAADGFSEIEKNLNRAKFSGLGTEPYMRAAPDSTTQALSHVIMALRSESAKIIQEPVQREIERILNLELRLAGIAAKAKLEFNPVQISGIQLEHAQAKKAQSDAHEKNLATFGRPYLKVMAEDVDIPLEELEAEYDKRMKLAEELRKSEQKKGDGDERAEDKQGNDESESESQDE